MGEKVKQRKGEIWKKKSTIQPKIWGIVPFVTSPQKG